VLGELLGGILLGNVPLFGHSLLERLKSDPTLDMLGRIGALILLFEVGLESTVAQMLRVGLSSLLVAAIGVIGPFILGYGAAAWLLPGSSAYEHAFIGTVLCATSVGITARVFKDLGRVQTPEARIVLGAAVIEENLLRVGAVEIYLRHVHLLKMGRHEISALLASSSVRYESQIR